MGLKSLVRAVKKLFHEEHLLMFCKAAHHQHTDKGILVLDNDGKTLRSKNFEMKLDYPIKIRLRMLLNEPCSSPATQRKCFSDGHTLMSIRETTWFNNAKDGWDGVSGVEIALWDDEEEDANTFCLDQTDIYNLLTWMEE